LHPDQVDQCRQLATIDGIVVIAYGLRTDFRTRLFPGTQRLLEVADNIEELKTMCRCMKNGKAIFNARLVNGVMTKDGDQVAIDGENDITYEPLCSTCYLSS
jgi:thymidine kinase